MKKKPPINYAELLHCETPEEVRERVREWSSSLSDDDHLVRSTILDIHASLEFRLKQIVFLQMLPLLGHYSDSDAAKQKRDVSKLEQSVRRLSFTSLQNLLEPAFKAYGSSDIDHVWDINKLRNEVAHRTVGKVRYKGRNPFTDHDCLAQIFFDSWAARKELAKFVERRIEGPRLLREEHEASCTLHFDCSKGLR